MGKKIAWFLVALIIFGVAGMKIIGHSYVKVDSGQRGIKRQWGKFKIRPMFPVGYGIFHEARIWKTRLFW